MQWSHVVLVYRLPDNPKDCTIWGSNGRPLSDNDTLKQLQRQAHSWWMVDQTARPVIFRAHMYGTKKNGSAFTPPEDLIVLRAIC